MRLGSSNLPPASGPGASHAHLAARFPPASPPAHRGRVARSREAPPRSPPGAGELAGVRRMPASASGVPFHPFTLARPMDPENAGGRSARARPFPGSPRHAPRPGGLLRRVVARGAPGRCEAREGRG